MKVIEIDCNNAEQIARYDRLFEECSDALIQQSTYWGSVIKDRGPDKPIYLLCEDGDRDVAGMPLYLYEHELGNIITSVPQPGPMGGVFMVEGLDQDQIRQVYQVLLDKAADIGRRHACMTLTLITNPFMDDYALYKDALAPDLVLENFTQYIPLSEMFKNGQFALRDYNRRSNLSRNLKRSHDFGFSVKLCESEDELKCWYEIHRLRHLELGATPLDYQLFDNIYKNLVPRQKAQIVLLKHEGQIASGCVYVYHRSVMDVYMLSMNSYYTGLGANFMLTEYSLFYAQELGLKIYNWQSSQSRQSGVYAFKRQWGSIEKDYYFVTKLLCDKEKILNIGCDRLKTQYKGHYVVPFKVFVDGFQTQYYRKG